MLALTLRRVKNKRPSKRQSEKSGDLNSSHRFFLKILSPGNNKSENFNQKI